MPDDAEGQGQDTCDLLCLDLQKAEPIRASLPEAGRLAQEAGAIGALGDPTRLAIAIALGEEDACTCELAWILGHDRRLVARQAHTLEAAGVARSRREGRRTVYGLTERGRVLMAALLGGRGPR